MDRLDFYAALVREFEPMLRGYVTSLIGGDHALADDIAQETFLLAYQHFSSLRSDTSFGAWIRSIARRVAWKELARRRREIPWDPEVIQGMEELMVVFDDPARGDDWGDRLSSVRACFESLARLLREPSRLYYFERRRTEEIAREIGATPATIRKRLERARTALKDCVVRRLGLAETAP